MPLLSADVGLGHDVSSDPFGDLGDDGVAEASKSVHPVGNPMSHSTHVGFNCPVIYVPVVIAAALELEPPAESLFDAVGVGNITALVSDWYSPLARVTLLASSAVGVGHIPDRAITANDVIVNLGPPGMRAFIAKCASAVLPSSDATDVGSNGEQSPSEVRCTDCGRRYAEPFRVVPDLGQVSEYSSEAQGKVPWDVLQQRVSGS
jgi:hypothetical protein